MNQTNNELLDLEPKDIVVNGGMFLPARFPFKSSMTTSDLASPFFTADNVELGSGS